MGESGHEPRPDRRQQGKAQGGSRGGGQVILLKKVATTLDLARLALKDGTKLAATAKALAAPPRKITPPP